LADDLLSEVFANLIRNAVEFGGQEVRIAIRVEDYDGESVLVSVEDTGPGIPDPIKESIFHRFERGWVGGCGDGLGLFVVRTLVERYGGTIRVEDRVEGRPDLGAAFRFTLREFLSSGDDEDDEYLDEEMCD
jgi:signal transduction histidine kinase